MLPVGAFHTAKVDGPFVIACLEAAPDSERSLCFRPVRHEGRHAFIAASGRVWAVWGEDEHKAARERGHERLIAALIAAERQELADVAARQGGASC